MIEITKNRIPDEAILAPFKIEGKLNRMHYQKQWGRRFVVREDDGMVSVTLVNSSHKFLMSIYLVSSRKLIAVSGIFSLHWAMIKRAFREEYGDDIKIIGNVL